MTPAEFKSAREALNLSQNQLAEILGMGGDGGRTVRRWETETGTNARPPNPIACQVLRWMTAGFDPREYEKKGDPA